MANTVPSLVASGTLPSSSEGITSRPVLSGTWRRTAGLQHYAHARGQLTRVSQSWPGDLCELGNADGKLTWPWRVPMLGTHHTTMDVWVEVTASTKAGLIRAIGTAGVASVAVAGIRQWYQMSPLTVAAGSATDDIYLDTNGLTAGEELTLHTVSMHMTPLASPLPTTVAVTPAGRFVPLGDTTLGDDYPLSSGRLRAMSENVEDLYQRGRVLYAWAGIHDDVVTYKGASTTQPNMQTRPHLSMPRLQLGDTAYSGDYTVSAYVARSASADGYVRVGLTPNGGVTEYTVATGAAGKVWISGTLDLAEAPNFGGMARLKNTGISVYPGEAASVSPHSTAAIYSITISGV